MKETFESLVEAKCKFYTVLKSRKIDTKTKLEVLELSGTEKLFF